MNVRICPRSPREVMQGWTYLPRYIDETRLHLAGKLHADYQPMQERLRLRKEQSGFAHRDDIRTLVDYIDADEDRL
jgi:hypothetical protein